MAELARARAKEAAEQVNQARESVRLTTAWRAQAAAAQDTAQGQLAVAAGAREAAQRTLEHQQGAATLSANLKAQREAQAASVVAQRNLSRAQADYNAAVASGSRADAAATAAKGRLILAQEAAAVATDKLSAARVKESASGAAAGVGGVLASGLRSAGSGFLALAGGPWGAAAIAVGALGMAYVDAKRKSEDARKEFDEQAKSLGVLTFAIKDATEQYKALNGSVSLKDLAATWNESGVAVRKADADIAALVARVADYEAKVAAARAKLEVGAGGGGDFSFFSAQLQQARGDLEKLTSEAAPARRAFLDMQDTLKRSIDPKLFEALRAAALKADDVQFTKLLAQLSDVERQGVSTADAIRKISLAGTDEVWKRQVDRLKREQGEYMSWLATEGKKYMDATGKASFNEAWQVLSPEQKADFQARAKFVREDVAAEKAWNEQQKANKAASREGLSEGKAQESQFQATIDRVQRQIALDKEQMGLTDDMTAAQRLQVVVTNEMASAKSKLSEAEQVRVRGLLEEAVAQGKALAAQEAAKKAAQDMLRLQQELREAARTQQQGNDVDLFSISRGSDAVEQMQRQVRLREEYDRRISALNDRNASANNGAGYSKEQYDGQLVQLDTFHSAALEREAQYQAERRAYMADWSNGAARAFEDYAAQAANVAELTNTLFTNAFTGLEDAIVGFVQSGKLSFSDLADSIIADLARIAAKQMITGLIGAMGQSFGPKITGFATGGYTGPGGRLEPAGIVHKGEGVLSQDDMSALGGPSAFHALRSSLRRGYAAGGIGGQSSGWAPMALGGSVAPQINVTVHGAPSGATASARRNDSGGFDLGVFMQQAIGAAAADVANGGQILSAIKGRLDVQERVG
jgi:lambda family phage tail tape measure protein